MRKAREELLVFHRALPWCRMRECSPDMAATEEINYRSGTKLAQLPCRFILAFQGPDEENLEQKSPGPTG